jgi:hypothetical protein
LTKELEKNLALRVETTDSADKSIVFGRGVMHLSVLIETMRREGYELQVGQPQVIVKEVDGKKQEPYETLVIDVPEEFSGKAIELVSQKKKMVMYITPFPPPRICDMEPSPTTPNARNQKIIVVPQTEGAAKSKPKLKQVNEQEQEREREQKNTGHEYSDADSDSFSETMSSDTDTDTDTEGESESEIDTTKNSDTDTDTDTEGESESEIDTTKNSDTDTESEKYTENYDQSNNTTGGGGGYDDEEKTENGEIHLVDNDVVQHGVDAFTDESKRTPPTVKGRVGGEPMNNPQEEEERDDYDDEDEDEDEDDDEDVDTVYNDSEDNRTLIADHLGDISEHLGDISGALTDLVKQANILLLHMRTPASASASASSDTNAPKNKSLFGIR